MRRIGVLIVSFVISDPSFAVTVPRPLDKAGRLAVVRVLGIQTSQKLLTNPFPLGGYDGFEFGLGIELVNVRDLDEGDSELRFPRLSFGKGLYNNVDLFLNVVPQASHSEIMSFGAAIRWSVYEAQFLPINVSLVPYAQHVNVNDDFSCLTLGGDLVAGIYVNNLSIYFGSGWLQGTGQFIAASSGSDATVDPSDPGVNSTTNMARETVKKSHSMMGMTFHWNEFFAALQLDRYPDTVYSGRIGLRF